MKAPWYLKMKLYKDDKTGCPMVRIEIHPVYFYARLIWEFLTRVEFKLKLGRIWIV